MCKGGSTSGGNEGSFTLFTCSKRIGGSHVEKVIIIGLEVNLQLESFNSRVRSKYKGRIIILNIILLLTNSSYFNPIVNEHLLLTKVFILVFSLLMTTGISKQDYLRRLFTKITLSNHLYLCQLLSNRWLSKCSLE